jgi:ABC-type nitrate/sulfonate/bicarbonate transport system substrate-binding protein
VARKSSGVESPVDLRGKKIGVSMGTTGQFVLEAGLEEKGLDRGEYKAVNLSPPDMVAGFQRGDLDAICT